MRAGWSGLLRKKEPEHAVGSDIAVTGRKLWGMGAVILASSAALLGTSSVDEPVAYTHYEFRRESIDGGSVDLTVDQPSATFFVNVTATDLGPEGVVTTTGAQAFVEGTVEAMGLSPGQVPPLVAVKVATTGAPGDSEARVADTFSSQFSLPFSGNCEQPSTGAACSTHLSIEVRRLDDGEAGGKLTFAWHFALSSVGQVERLGGEEDVELGPLDPPWTVKVTEP